MTVRKLSEVLEGELGEIPSAALAQQTTRWERDGRGDARRAVNARRRQRAALAVALSGAALLVLLLGGVLWRGAQPTAARAPGVGDAAAPALHKAAALAFDVPTGGGVRSIALGPGETIAAQPGARGVVARAAPHTRVSLTEGTLVLSLRPSQGKRWSVSAGPYEVEVVGTQFRVSWQAAARRLELEVEQGRVRVRGGGFGAAGRELGPGEVLTAGAGDTPAASATPESPPASPAGASTTADWRALGRERRYAEALAAANRIGFERLCNTLGPAELSALADVARLAGDPGRAEQALSSLRRRFPGSREAATAAFLLGRQGATPAHTRWLETYLAEQPGGPYAQEALGRLMASSHERGEQVGASARARQYLAAYPGGPYAKHARSILAEASDAGADR